MNVDEVKDETEEVKAKDKDKVNDEDVAKDEEDSAEDFSYKVAHRDGSKMCHVDSLSQNSIMVIRDDETLLKMKHAQQDDELLAIMHILVEKD